MHYYQHHIGDFIKDTSFLTNEEVGIYLKLLWIYYDTEVPLPDSLFELSMKVNAREQQEVLQGILEMFFKLQEDGWHHTRCDKEIAFYQQQIDTASRAGKASAAKRAINKINTNVQHVFNDCSTTVQPTSNQEPVTNNHIVKQNRGSRLQADFCLTDEWKEFCRTERSDLDPQKVFDGFKDYWIAKAGQQGVKLDWLATWRNWVRNQKQGVVNKADQVFTTVPSRFDRDPALIDVENKLKQAVPMPPEIRAAIERLRK
jgi:uncharacterized protein YdaU (DUF1376 family)